MSAQDPIDRRIYEIEKFKCGSKRTDQAHKARAEVEAKEEKDLKRYVSVLFGCLNS